MSSRGLLTKNFGGIDAKASRLNIKDNEAESIVNWDIGIDGAITRRLGCAKLTASSLGTPFQHLGRFFGTDNVEYFVAIAGTSIYRSTDLVTWTDVTGSVSLAGGSEMYRGTAWRNKYIVGNGVNEPFYVAQTGNATTLKAASILEPPSVYPSILVTGVPVGTSKTKYVVTALTARGETSCSGVISYGSLANDPIGGTAAVYNTIYFTPVAGASAYNIYVGTDSGVWTATPVLAGGSTVVVPQGAFVLRDTVDPSATTWSDTKGSYISGGAMQFAPSTNDAYRTPENWDGYGNPEGFSSIAAGRDERLLAWRGNTIWASGLGDPLEWLTAGDAFVFTVTSTTDNRVTGIGSLFDYTVIFTRTDALIYTGASGSTITLQKQVPMGCPSHYSIQPVGDDFYFWSQHGPTTFKRIMSGADIQSTTNFNRNIQPLLANNTNKDAWDRMVVYNDPLNNRVVWWVPGASQTSNTYGLVFQYDVNAWTSYNDWTPVSVVRASDGAIYAGFSDGNVYQLHTGYNDAGAAIVATYTTGNLDIASWPPLKRIPFVDVVMDRSPGAYTLNFTWNMDAGRQVGDTVTLTQTNTNGSPISISGPNMNYHRIHTFGIGNTCQLTFTAASVNQGVKVLGWATEVAAKGRRE